MDGTITGGDYLHIRADGRIQIHIHGEITTHDGQKIGAFIDGVATPEEATGLFQTRKDVTLTSSSPQYSWFNQVEARSQGTLDPAKGEVRENQHAA